MATPTIVFSEAAGSRRNRIMHADIKFLCDAMNAADRAVNSGSEGTNSRRNATMHADIKFLCDTMAKKPTALDVDRNAHRSHNTHGSDVFVHMVPFLQSLANLHWRTPRGLPHGFSGVCTIVLGAYLIAGALRGDLSSFQHGTLPALYALAATANAVSGAVIAQRAPSQYRSIFLLCALFQCCLVYCTWRFSPRFPLGGTSAAAAADAAVALLAVLAIVSFAAFGLLRLPPAIGFAVAIGSFALALLAGYPLQLAILGESWWTCVQRAYPLQGAAMVAYIYVPATWAFALMLFGATLWSRRLIGDIGLGLGFAGLVCATLVTTVLSQEVHHPEPLSTQKLWLPCPSPAPGSWSAWAQEHLDTSALAKTALRLLRSVFTI